MSFFSVHMRPNPGSHLPSQDQIARERPAADIKPGDQIVDKDQPTEVRPDGTEIWRSSTTVVVSK